MGDKMLIEHLRWKKLQWDFYGIPSISFFEELHLGYRL